MTIAFKSVRQERLFESVLANLVRLGYTDGLLQRQYSFVDYFESARPERTVAAAAFGQTPQSYDSACFAVLVSNGVSGEHLVNQNRALGAPLAFEIREDAVLNWRVGRDIAASKELIRIEPDQIPAVFADHQADWSAQDVLRRKGISFKLGPRQLDFIDLGLIPALEQQIATKLDRVLREVVQESIKLLKLKNSSSQDTIRGLYRLIFRFLAGKVLHDRGIPPFDQFSTSTPREDILEGVAKYYGEEPPVLADSDLQRLVASSIWTELDFRNLSVEVLAYIYENTFVDEEARRELGTHSTPHSIARYVVHQIPFDKLAQDQRQTLEPFCGHGVFLVAALQRLRELLPATMDGDARHEYFVRMLKGFEIDQFALEVSRLCLMLADFPNHNGWKLNSDDVFTSRPFDAALRQSHIILSNPPFEDFSTQEKARYQATTSVHKPVELLNRILTELPSNGLLGIVLPKQFIDGRGYKDVREKLYQRFESIQLVSLPDRVFENSEIETVLLTGTEPRKNATPLAVYFSEVGDKEREQFLANYSVTRHDEALKTFGEATNSLHVVRFREVWEGLKEAKRLGAFAEIHRGVEWQAPFQEQLYVSRVAKEGFQPGLLRAENLAAFERPESVYLNVQMEHQRGGAFNYAWHSEKVIMNAVRISRGPWKLAAFTDSTGLLCSQNFHALWPREPWTSKCLAAVLNSPLANAFVDSHEIAKHIRKQTVAAIPLPSLNVDQIYVLDRLVDHYLKALRAKEVADRPLLTSSNEEVSVEEESARDALLAIDAFVVRAYSLPPWTERELLDSFSGIQRAVSIPFKQYFPRAFKPAIPLWMYISAEYRQCNARSLLEKIPIITDEDLIEALEEVGE